MRAVSILAAGVMLWALPLSAGEVFPDIEYITGKAGLDDKVKGSLVLDEKEIRFNDKNQRSVFSIPIEQVVNATQSREREEGSFGRKMALGIFASKNAEYLRVETKTPEGADVLIFKTKKEKSPGMVAKINLHRDNVKNPSTP
jgi:hypothetical protein